MRTFMRHLSVSLALGAVTALGCSSESLSGPSEGGSGTPSPGEAPGEVVGTGFAALDYPPGPYGHGVGSIIENLSFLGWKNPADAGYALDRLETVRLSDFYNPGGTKNDVRAIVVNASAVWCTVCRAEYRHIQGTQIYDRYRSRGVEILGVLFEDRDANPATPQDLQNWAGENGYALEFPFVLDPALKTGAYFTSDATPLNMVIDATTMEILDIVMGYDSSDPEAYWTDIDTWLGP